MVDWRVHIRGKNLEGLRKEIYRTESKCEKELWWDCFVTEDKKCTALL